eukprot:g60034.t1
MLPSGPPVLFRDRRHSDTSIKYAAGTTTMSPSSTSAARYSDTSIGYSARTTTISPSSPSPAATSPNTLDQAPLVLKWSSLCQHQKPFSEITNASTRAKLKLAALLLLAIAKLTSIYVVWATRLRLSFQFVENKWDVYAGTNTILWQAWLDAFYMTFFLIPLIVSLLLYIISSFRSPPSKAIFTSQRNSVPPVGFPFVSFLIALKNVTDFSLFKMAVQQLAPLVSFDPPVKLRLSLRRRLKEDEPCKKKYELGMLTGLFIGSLPFSLAFIWMKLIFIADTLFAFADAATLDQVQSIRLTQFAQLMIILFDILSLADSAGAWKTILSETIPVSLELWRLQLVGLDGFLDDSFRDPQKVDTLYLYVRQLEKSNYINRQLDPVLKSLWTRTCCCSMWLVLVIASAGFIGFVTFLAAFICVTTKDSPCDADLEKWSTIMWGSIFGSYFIFFFFSQFFVFQSWAEDFEDDTESNAVEYSERVGWMQKGARLLVKVSLQKGARLLVKVSFFCSSLALLTWWSMLWLSPWLQDECVVMNVRKGCKLIVRAMGTGQTSKVTGPWLSSKHQCPWETGTSFTCYFKAVAPSALKFFKISTSEWDQQYQLRVGLGLLSLICALGLLVQEFSKSTNAETEAKTDTSVNVETHTEEKVNAETNAKPITNIETTGTQTPTEANTASSTQISNRTMVDTDTLTTMQKELGLVQAEDIDTETKTEVRAETETRIEVECAKTDIKNEIGESSRQIYAEEKSQSTQQTEEDRLENASGTQLAVSVVGYGALAVVTALLMALLVWSVVWSFMHVSSPLIQDDCVVIWTSSKPNILDAKITCIVYLESSLTHVQQVLTGSNLLGDLASVDSGKACPLQINQTVPCFFRKASPRHIWVRKMHMWRVYINLFACLRDKIMIEFT